MQARGFVRLSKPAGIGACSKPRKVISSRGASPAGNGGISTVDTTEVVRDGRQRRASQPMRSGRHGHGKAPSSLGVLGNGLPS